MSKNFNRTEKKFDSSQDKFLSAKNNSNELNEAMEKIKYIFIEKENKISQQEEKIELLNEENKNLHNKIEAMANENENLTNKISSINKELYLAKQTIEELCKEQPKTLNYPSCNNNPKASNSNSNNNNNNIDSDTQDLKSTNSGNANALKFPNNITAGLNNIKNIDESELNESYYHNPTFSDNYKNNKNIDIKNVNKLPQYSLNVNEKEKNKVILTGGVPNLRINKNPSNNLPLNTSGYLIKNKNNFNDSNMENIVNVENRSNSYQKYNRNLDIPNSNNTNNLSNITITKEPDISLKSSNDKFNPNTQNPNIINNILNNNKSHGNLNISKGNSFTHTNNNLNTESNFNISKVNSNENSGRSSPIFKNIPNNYYYTGNAAKIDINNRIRSDSDLGANQQMKNRIPIGNKNARNEAQENKIPRNSITDSNSTCKYKDLADQSDKVTSTIYREKLTSNIYDSSDYESGKQKSKYETANNFYSSKPILPNQYNNSGSTYNINSEYEKNIPPKSNNNISKNFSPIPGNNHNNYNTPNINNTPNIMSPKVVSQDSRDEIKEFLLKVKERIPAKDFKDFIADIKMLTDKNRPCNKNEIINHVNMIFENHRDLYDRFEEILLIKKN